MVDPSTHCREASGELFTASVAAWSQILKEDRHWPGRGWVGVDSGKRWFFFYQRVLANAISPEHLGLQKINRSSLPHSSGMLAAPGYRVRLGDLLIHRSKACH